MATPQALALASTCYMDLVRNQLDGMKVYLLAQILHSLAPMADITPQGLATASTCYGAAASGNQLLAQEVYLLTQIAISGGVGPPPVPPPQAYRQVYQGHGDPNGIVIGGYPSLWGGGAPLDPDAATIYQNLDTPGEEWVWDIANAVWL